MRSVPSKVVFGAENAYGTFNKYIEDIQIGDMVLAIDERTGEQSYKPVKQTFIRTAPRIYNIQYEDGTVIETTWSHPFYIKRSDILSKAKMFMVSFSDDSSVATMKKIAGLENGQWIKAEDIRAGDVSFTASGKQLRISKVTVDMKSETVYNFEVDEHHNYYVSESGVLVHNETGYMTKNGRVDSVYDLKKLDYNEILSYQNSGFFGKVGERFGNFFSGEGFSSDEALIEEAALRGKGVEAEKIHSLGYQLTDEQEKDYINLQFRSNIKRINEGRRAIQGEISLYGSKIVYDTPDDWANWINVNDWGNPTPEDVVQLQRDEVVNELFHTAFKSDVDYLRIVGMGRARFAPTGPNQINRDVVSSHIVSFDITDVGFNHSNDPYGGIYSPVNVPLTIDGNLERFANNLLANPKPGKFISPFGYSYNTCNVTNISQLTPRTAGDYDAIKHYDHLHYSVDSEVYQSCN